MPELNSCLKDLPDTLTRAFKFARDAAAPYMDADDSAGNAKERDVLGEDPYAYRMAENEKRTLAALNLLPIVQGLLKSMLPMDQLSIN